MSKNRESWGQDTKLNHPERVRIHEGNIPLLQPVYHSAKFTASENHPVSEQFIYGRVGNPTTRQLELTLAEIQKREDCIVMSSGIGALTGTFLGLLQKGDHMITFRELYKPARMFIRDFLPRYGISSSVLPLSDMSKLESNIKPETKLIHFESPTNPNLHMADIEAIISIARKHNLLVSMDGTFGGLHQHTEFDLDVMVQSLTKYANGHGDVIAGSIAGRKTVLNRIREFTTYQGSHLDPEAAYRIQRGLKTYILRYERQTRTAGEIAEYLSTHPMINWVKYPGMTEKDRALVEKQMKQKGGVVSFEIKHDAPFNADKFCRRLNVIQLTASIGSTESIICPTLSFFGGDLTEEERREMGISTHSLRLSVGLEDARDLIEDLKEALG